MSQYIIIDGTEYQVSIIDLKRTAVVLDRYALTSEDGVLNRSVIGTFLNYTLAIEVINNIALYEELFYVLSAPIDFHAVELPTDHREFQGYFSSVQDTVSRVTEDGTIYKGLTCNLIAQSPWRTP